MYTCPAQVIKEVVRLLLLLDGCCVTEKMKELYQETLGNSIKLNDEIIKECSAEIKISQESKEIENG